MHGSSDALKRLALTKAFIFDKSAITKKYGPVKYYPLQSVLMIPPYYMGSLIGKMFGEPEKRQYRIAYRFCAFLYNPIIITVLAVVFFNFLRRLKIGVEHRILSLTTLLYSTLLFPYTRIMFSEPLSALLVLLSVIHFYHSTTGDFKRHCRISFICCGFLILNGPVWFVYFSLMLAAFVIYSIYQKKSRSEKINIFTAFAIILSIILVALVFYNVSRYGSFLPEKYDAKGFDRPILPGVYGLIFSIGNGIIFYSPITALVVLFFIFTYNDFPSSLRYTFLISTLSFLCFIILYAKWWAGLSPWQWGPRFLLPFVPALHLIFPFTLESLKRTDKTRMILFVFLCAFATMVNWLEFLGVWSGYVGDALNNNPQYEIKYFNLIFSPENSAIFNSWDSKYASTRGMQFLLSVSLFYFLTMRFKKYLR